MEGTFCRMGCFLRPCYHVNVCKWCQCHYVHKISENVPNTILYRLYIFCFFCHAKINETVQPSCLTTVVISLLRSMCVVHYWWLFSDCNVFHLLPPLRRSCLFNSKGDCCTLVVVCSLLCALLVKMYADNGVACRTSKMPAAQEPIMNKPIPVQEPMEIRERWENLWWYEFTFTVDFMLLR